MKTRLLTTILALSLSLAAQAPNEPFPLRARFPQLEYVGTAQLQAAADAIVVDVRNRIEFDVVHVEGARHLDVDAMKKTDLEALRAPAGAQWLVFYCNGFTCRKSYDAAEKARIWGFANCRVYDAGVFEWAETVPERTRFFGELLTRETVRQKLIPKSELKAVSLRTAEFVQQAKSGECKVYDIRDTKDRQDYPVKLPKIAKLTMDEFVAQLAKGGIPERILVLDNIGRQVDWLQYYLRKHGHRQHQFLLGGIEQWRKDGFDNDGNPPAAAPGK